MTDTASAPDAELLPGLHRRAVRLEQFSIAWILIEAGVALTAGIMPLLGWRKRRVGSALRNPLVLADAAETILCAMLAATTLLGLVLFAALGWWWADPVAALAVAWFAVREGREAWHGELADED